MKKFILFSLLFINILLTSCNGSSTSYWIDNPTTNPITIYIDDEAYDIPETTMIEINLKYGKHKLKYNNEVLSFHNGGRVNNTQAIINPTQSTYIFYKQLFINENDERATDDFMAWALKTQSDSIRINVNDTIRTLFVPFQASNKIFISKDDFDWKYNIDEPMPKGIKLSNPIVTRRNRQLLNDENYQAGKFQETIYKIYREQDFKDYIKQVSSDKIEFLLERTTYEKLPKVNIKLTKINNISDPEYKKALEEYVQEINDWLDMSGSKSTSGFKDVFISQELNNLKSEFLKKHPNDYSFNEAVNELQDQINPFLRFQLNIID